MRELYLKRGQRQIDTATSQSPCERTSFLGPSSSVKVGKTTEILVDHFIKRYFAELLATSASREQVKQLVRVKMVAKQVI